ncbi:MAG: phycobiliprotein lyase [Cyanobacteria bacterium P01_F01_bin.33]
MNAMEFWQQSEGEWFSHRTSHDIAQQQSDSEKAMLAVTLVEPNPADLATIYQTHGISEQPASVKELNVATYGDVRSQEDLPKGSLTLLILPDTEDGQTGRLLGADVSSTFTLGADGVLEIIGDRGDLQVEERIWFESPNLRLRTSSVAQQGTLLVASFFSEIRRVQAPPKS